MLVIDTTASVTVAANSAPCLTIKIEDVLSVVAVLLLDNWFFDDVTLHSAIC